MCLLRKTTRFCLHFARLGMSTKAPSAAANHWSNALVAALDNPQLQVITTPTLVAIRDKFPKARHHYLILPRADIPSIYHLTAEHIPLLAELELLATNCIELCGLPSSHFQCGYHASPSMQRLHLHVISLDFQSDHLKTRAHWNSFTTPHFRPMAEVHGQLVASGKVQRPSEAEMRECRERELRCHRCDLRPRTMPELKRHLVAAHSP